MRTVPVALQPMVASRMHTRSRCARLELRDGTVLGITDHDVDLVVVVEGNENTYSATTGVIPGDIVLATGLDTDSVEISGPLSDLITRANVLGKRYNRAQVWLFDVDWTQPVAGIIPIIYGNIADSKIESSKFKFEVRNLFDRFNQTIGRVLAPYCTADYGDGQCTKVRTPYPAVITGIGVQSDFVFEVDEVQVDGFFNLGTIEFVTGELAGIEESEIFSYFTDGTVELLVPLPVAPQIGDEIIIRRGCSKLKSSEDATLSTCLSNENVINFRGFDRVPGSDTYLKVPVPGSGGA